MVATLGWVVAVLQGLAATAAIVLWHAVDGRRRRGARRLAPLLSLIVVRPIRGLDPGLAQNVRAALAQRYPGALETIFVLDDTSDPAYPVGRRLVDASWARARVVIAGPLPRGRTGKLHTMIEGLRAARLDARLVGFADSDTGPAPTLLAELARAVVAQADVGAAFAPGASVGQLVDDMDIGTRLAHAGFRNVLIGAPIAIGSEGMTWAAFRVLALRWMVYSRTGIPLWPFGMPAMVLMLAFHVTVIAAIIAGWLGTVIGAILFTLAALAGPVALQALRRRQGAAPVPRRLVWAIPLVLWLIPLFFVQALFARTVEWCARRDTLGPGGGLRGVRPPTTRGVRRARSPMILDHIHGHRGTTSRSGT